MRTIASYHPASTGHRWWRAVLTLLMLAPAMVAGVIVAAPAANAGCGLYPTISFADSTYGVRAVEERQYPSTCTDGDSVYRGRVLDAVDDGTCAYALFWDPSQSTNGTSCTTGGWVNFTFWDQQSNSSAMHSVYISTAFPSWGPKYPLSGF